MGSNSNVEMSKEQSVGYGELPDFGKYSWEKKYRDSSALLEEGDGKRFNQIRSEVLYLHAKVRIALFLQMSFLTIIMLCAGIAGMILISKSDVILNLLTLIPAAFVGYIAGHAALRKKDRMDKFKEKIVEILREDCDIKGRRITERAWDEIYEYINVGIIDRGYHIALVTLSFLYIAIIFLRIIV